MIFHMRVRIFSDTLDADQTALATGELRKWVCDSEHATVGDARTAIEQHVRSRMAVIDRHHDENAKKIDGK
jgi:hypothetical protein